VETYAGTVTLLLNTAAGLVACVEGDRPFPADARYTDVPSPTSFEDLGLVVAGPDRMTAAWTAEALSRLGAEEAEQVRYHRPARTGDVLFTWFD
jgi:hypothetical protein